MSRWGLTVNSGGYLFRSSNLKYICMFQPVYLIRAKLHPLYLVRSIFIVQKNIYCTLLGVRLVANRGGGTDSRNRVGLESRGQPLGRRVNKMHSITERGVRVGSGAMEYGGHCRRQRGCLVYRGQYVARTETRVSNGVSSLY